MAKRGTKKKPTERADEARRAKKPVGHENGKRVSALRGRVNTIPSNGDLPQSAEILPEPISIGEAMRKAAEALGDMVIDLELAPAQLRELGELYEDVARRQAAFNAKNEEAKTAKKSLESAQEMLLGKVKAFTHPAPLPLFDQQQAEDDEADMKAAGRGVFDDPESGEAFEPAFS